MRKIVMALSVLSVASTASAALKITEIMYDPSGSNEFEYLELYNTGTSDIDLAGYVFARAHNIAVNGTANVLAGTVPAGGSAVLIRTDGNTGTSGRTLAGYQLAWQNANNPTINFVPVNSWPTLTNSGLVGVGIWDSFADYALDKAATDTTLTPVYANAVTSVIYGVGTGGWPTNNDRSSIYLRTQFLDPTVPGNWSLSAIGIDGAYSGASGTIVVGSSNVTVNRANDIGSPGILVVPEPATLTLLAAGATIALARRRGDSTRM